MDFSTSTADALFDAGYEYSRAQFDLTGMGDVVARLRVGPSSRP